MALLSACDAPVEEDSAAFRCLDAEADFDEVDDDEEGIDGTPGTLCELCGNHWMADGDEVQIFLRKQMGRGVLPLSKKAKFFFFDHQLQQIDLRTDRATVLDGGWYKLTGRISLSKPAIVDGRHANPRVGGIEAVLRLEHDHASVDVRLDRYQDAGATQQQTPAVE